MIVENLFHGTEDSEFVPKTVVHMDGSVSKGECRIVSEHGMELFLNEKLTMKLVCTPSNLTELIIGRLISEGYIESTDEIEMIYICSNGKRARVFLNDTASEAIKLTQVVEEIPTCCTDNQVFLQNQNGRKPKIQRHSKPIWKSEWILHLRINLFPILKYTERLRGHTAAISA